MTSLKLFFLIKISYNYLLHIFQVEAFHSTKLAFPSVRIRVSIPLDLHVKNPALGGHFTSPWLLRSIHILTIICVGMVDLPEDNREAAMNAITLPEVSYIFYILSQI